ncbi:MAG TPA: phytanoyl-CoA dioxygenase family protein [Terriglobia bacterium]|nr:phytanoyl-CoA dioxygenase family protein [Terriglobia bacterium]
MTRSSSSSKLGAEQRLEYQEKGYYYPIQVIERSEAEDFRARFLDYLAHNKQRLAGLPPRDHYVVLTQTQFLFRWIYGIVSHPKVLDAVESVLGSNIIVWSTQWFPKMPGDHTYVSWHQDATYWGLHPPQVTTGWIALSESCVENGCMRVVPGTHEGPLLPQVETYAQDNMLSRGQEILAEVDESHAVNMVLQPGEMSLHHIGIIHGSNPNRSDEPRIGIAVRYIAPEVIQEGAARQMALLVRGKDDFGHFQLVEPPQDDLISDHDAAVHLEALRRLRSNTMPEEHSPR